jgi:hypothetical protein
VSSPLTIKILRRRGGRDEVRSDGGSRAHGDAAGTVKANLRKDEGNMCTPVLLECLLAFFPISCVICWFVLFYHKFFSLVRCFLVFFTRKEIGKHVTFQIMVVCGGLS